MKESKVLFQSSYVNNNEFLKNYEEQKKNNETSNKLTKFEITSIIGIHATQLSQPKTKVFIEVPNNMTDVVKIAELELQKKKTPFIIERDLVTKKEYWKIEDMII